MTEAIIRILPCWQVYIKEHPQECALYGGSGSGKTYFMLQHCVLTGLEDTDGFSLVLMEDVTSVKSDCYDLAVMMLDELGVKFEVRESPPFEIRLPAGHTIVFTSTSRSSGERSSERMKKFTNAKRVYINEITAIREEDYDIITNRMGRSFKDAQVLVTFNPIGAEHWCVRKWVHPYKAGTLPKGTMVIHTTYKDNKTLTKEWIAREIAKGERNPNYQRVYLEGEPGILEGLVYIEGVHWDVLPEDEWPKELDSITPHGVGMDWGSGTTAAGATWVYEGKRYHRELMYEPGIIQEQINGRMNAIYDSFGWSKSKSNMIRCDHEIDRIYSLAHSGFMSMGELWDPGAISNAKRMGHPLVPHVCIPAYKDVSLGIDQVMEQKIYIHPSSRNLIKELRNYMYDPKATEKGVKVPLKGYDHAIDAMRYSMAYKPDKEVRRSSQRVTIKGTGYRKPTY